MEKKTGAKIKAVWREVSQLPADCCNEERTSQGMKQPEKKKIFDPSLSFRYMDQL